MPGLRDFAGAFAGFTQGLMSGAQFGYNLRAASRQARMSEEEFALRKRLLESESALRSQLLEAYTVPQMFDAIRGAEGPAIPFDVIREDLRGTRWEKVKNITHDPMNKEFVIEIEGRSEPIKLSETQANLLKNYYIDRRNTLLQGLLGGGQPHKIYELTDYDFQGRPTAQRLVAVDPFSLSLTPITSEKDTVEKRRESAREELARMRRLYEKQYGGRRPGFWATEKQRQLWDYINMLEAYGGEEEPAVPARRGSPRSAGLGAGLGGPAVAEETALTRDQEYEIIGEDLREHYDSVDELVKDLKQQTPGLPEELILKALERKGVIARRRGARK